MIRLRAFGKFAVRISNAQQFVNEVVGTQGVYTTDGVEGYFNQVNLYMDGIAVASLQVPADHELTIEPSVYCPEFGKQLSNQVLVISKTTTLPVTLNYTIRNQKL